ncbi:hypothetical protein NDU88_002404, partial [Pleurodeles waltl]
SLGSALGFLRRGWISACFQLSGKVAEVKERLMILRSSGAMVAFAELKTWWGQGSVGEPEWMVFMVA